MRVGRGTKGGMLSPPCGLATPCPDTLPTACTPHTADSTMSLQPTKGLNLFCVDNHTHQCTMSHDSMDAGPQGLGIHTEAVVLQLYLIMKSQQSYLS